jgi:hypothetical protein
LREVGGDLDAPLIIDPDVPDNGVDDLEALVVRQSAHPGADPAEHLA